MVKLHMPLLASASKRKKNRFRRITGERSRRMLSRAESPAERCLGAVWAAASTRRSASSTSDTAIPTAAAARKAPRQPHSAAAVIIEIGAAAVPARPEKVWIENAVPIRLAAIECERIE